MAVLLIEILLFSLGAIYTLFTGDITNSLAGFTISLFVFSIFLYLKHEQKKSDNFLNWLFENKSQIANNLGSYNGVRVTPKTVITQYEIYFCFFIFSSKAKSKYVILHNNNKFLYRIKYCLITLVFGWWGLPFGPLKTITTVYKNLSDNNKISVGKMLNINTEYDGLISNEINANF